MCFRNTLCFVFVLTQAQYILIHQALLEHNQFGETEIALSELHSTLNTLRQKNSDNEPTLMEEEYDVCHFIVKYIYVYIYLKGNAFWEAKRNFLVLKKYE